MRDIENAWHAVACCRLPRWRSASSPSRWHTAKLLKPVSVWELNDLSASQGAGTLEQTFDNFGEQQELAYS